MRFASGFDRLGRYLAASTDNHQHSQLLLPTVQWSELPKWMILVAADRKLTSGVGRFAIGLGPSSASKQGQRNQHCFEKLHGCLRIRDSKPS
jgi:hypothetical protein